MIFYRSGDILIEETTSQEIGTRGITLKLF